MEDDEHKPDVEVNFHEEPPKKSGTGEFVKKALVIGLIIILIIVGSWAVIRLAPSIFSGLASISVSVSKIFKPKATPIPAVSTPTPTPVIIVSTPTPTPAPVVSYPDNSGTTDYTPTPTPVAAYNQNTRADLVLYILATGVIDRNTNVFVTRPSIDASERAAVRFEVQNAGGRASGAWAFSMLMPVVAGKDTYSSPTERSLAPGEKMQITVGFDNIRSGRQPVTISVDEGGLVSESRKDNNAGTVYFSVTGDAYYGNNDVYYPPANNYYGNGLPDLAIRVIGIGTVDPYTGAFRPTGQLYSNQRVGVQFEVRNDGGTATGRWAFNADLPTNADSSFESDLQPSLRPGERIIITIGFDNLDTNYSDDYRYDDYRYDYRGNYTAPVTITLDPDRDIRESSENNNTLRISIPIVY
ncbi:MAG: CARDB domain-containing protein [Candidatus Pacebacteria bacterium]|nr:CARDB domain-containing protein [Candidatus Paceibacterota bacterium]MDD5356616.1 CARDB domain-containing protein [Candidatus Paceibacterota bacterium]